MDPAVTLEKVPNHTIIAKDVSIGAEQGIMCI